MSECQHCGVSRLDLIAADECMYDDTNAAHRNLRTWCERFRASHGDVYIGLDVVEAVRAAGLYETLCPRGYGATEEVAERACRYVGAERHAYPFPSLARVLEAKGI